MLSDLPPERARALLPGLLADSRDAGDRQALLRIDRRLRLLASPIALADAPVPDLMAIVAAQGPEALREQASLVADRARPADVRAAAAEALGRAGTREAQRRLLDLARDAQASTRAFAAAGLGRKAPCAEAGAALSVLADDLDPTVRRAALTSLAGFPEQASTVARRLTVEREAGLRRAALATLAAAGGEAELPALLGLARTAPAGQREPALRAAHDLPAPEAGRPVVR
ncbi:MAG: HEAT repeat domain-containing protein [Planctomycetes bacterium]|nr:HEAT repeat domain-containing protein [Planctomycetota bacterium]